MPVLNLPISIGSGEDVAGLEILVFRAPCNIRKWHFALIADGCGQALLFYVEDLDGPVVTS